MIQHIHGPWKYTKWNKPDTKGKTLTIPSIWGTSNRQIGRKCNRQRLADSVTDGELFSGYRISVWDREKSLDMDSGDSCTTVNVFSASGSCT